MAVFAIFSMFFKRYFHYLQVYRLFIWNFGNAPQQSLTTATNSKNFTYIHHKIYTTELLFGYS